MSVEAGLMDMLSRMETGRFKVFKELNDWLEEFRLYHRKDGRVVKERDDLMSATRYAVMMLRYARTLRVYPVSHSCKCDFYRAHVAMTRRTQANWQS